MCMIGEFKRMRNVPEDKPIIAWRWFEEYGDGWLGPWVENDFGNPWRKHLAVAHEKPRGGSMAGLWAYTDGDENGRPFELSHYYIAGVLAVWGRCAIHENGVRAEFATILCITGWGGASYWNPEHHQALPRRIANKYSHVAVDV